MKQVKRIAGPTNGRDGELLTTTRRGAENSETRTQLIRLAARIIRDEGCAAVTARRLAGELGRKRQIVHYYFGTIEDLFVAVIRRGVGRLHEQAKQKLESGQPLRVIYGFSNSVSSALFEFTAMAMRSKLIRDEIQRYADEFRQIQTQAIIQHLTAQGRTPAIPPAATAFVINSLAHTLATEVALGVSRGHDETRALIEGWLHAFEQSGEWSVTPSTTNAGAKSDRRLASV